MALPPNIGVIPEFQHAIIQGLLNINEKWWKFWK